MIIGIDPDVAKSGVAIYHRTEKVIVLESMTFPQLVDYLLTLSLRCPYEHVSVLVEAGWLNKSNWHLTKYDTKKSAAAKGNATGRNHEVGRKIIEICDQWKIPCKEIKPLRKCWSGKEGKISHEEFALICSSYKIRCPKRSNQEERDAALIALASFIK